MRRLIINADGYGFTPGVTRAIEECIEFGTVRSLSANVNFPDAGRLPALARRHPFLSIGCHLNPVVGRPILPAREVPTLVDAEGNMHYRSFASRFQAGQIDRAELKAEMRAQIERTRDWAGACFSHVDFHMGLHRLPRLYPVFLEAAAESGTGRIRTHRYLAGMESRHPRWRHAAHMLEGADRLPKYAWNLLLRWRARRRGFAMPDWWLSITNMARPGAISLPSFLRMLDNVPEGISEFVAHPGYVDDELRRVSKYLDQRIAERQILLDERFRSALRSGRVELSGYRDIPAGRVRGVSGAAAPDPVAQGRR